MQLASAVAPGADVFLCAGQGAQGALLLVGAKKACAHRMQGFERSCGACAGPGKRPLPDGQRQWSMSDAPGSASSPAGQGDGCTAPGGQ